MTNSIECIEQVITDLELAIKVCEERYHTMHPESVAAYRNRKKKRAAEDAIKTLQTFVAAHKAYQALQTIEE
jgi:hypothetical protein